MKTKRRRCRLIRIWLAVLCMASLFTVASSPQAWARGPQKPFPGHQMQKRQLTINEKSPDYNYIFVGERRFKVSTSAEILDRRGRKLSLQDLRVPCSANITYQMPGDNRDPMVHRIQLR
ncbi:MAG: hypothetical protein AB1512_30740 [Thermodesulfobacteriota bacterium]